MIEWAWWIPVLPALSFAVILLLTRRSKALSAVISILTMAVCFAMSLGVLFELFQMAPENRKLVVPGGGIPWVEIKPFLITVGALIDPLSVNMLCVVTFISLLVQVYSLGYMRDDERFSTFFAYLSLFSASMLTLVVSPNYVQIFMAWELVGLSSYLLIGFWYFKDSAANACKKAFIVNRFADLLFLIGVITIGMTFQTFDFSLVDGVVKQGLANGSLSSGFVAGLALLLFSGAMGKSGQFPFHIWLPDAMEGPTPVSALIHAATMVTAGVYLIARTFTLFTADPLSMTVVAYTGAFTALFAATIALAQDDIKRVLAFSTLSQLGYMVLALGVGGYTAGMFHLTTHAFFKALLFLGAGSVIHSVHTNDIWEMGGLWPKMKATGWTFLIACLAISGIAPFAGFWSKDEIFVAVEQSRIPGHGLLLTAAVFTAFLTAFYMFRLFFVVFMGPRKKAAHGSTGGDSHGEPHESPLNMVLPLSILGFFSVVAGLVNAPGINAYSRFLYFGSEPEIGVFHFGLAGVSTLAAVAGIILAGAFYWKHLLSPAAWAEKHKGLYTLLKNKYYIDEIWAWLVENVLFKLATAFAWFDKRVVDGGMVDGAGWVTRRVGSMVRKTQTGQVQQYALVVFAMVAVLYFVLSFGF